MKHAAIALYYSTVNSATTSDSAQLGRGETEPAGKSGNGESCVPKEGAMSTIGIVLLIVLILILLGAVPTWPYSRSWGYIPSGFIGILLIVLIILLIAGKI
jgi:hypothetical protein